MGRENVMEVKFYDTVNDELLKFAVIISQSNGKWVFCKDAKEQGVLQIALEATDMGRPLYERYGFVKMEDKMELKV